MLTQQFNLLTPAELILLGQHLKLGEAHLRKHLNEEEVKQLLASLPLDSGQLAEIGRTDTETTSSLSLVLNTIFTATFGAWTGYSAFWGLSLASIESFASIVSLAALVGAFIGYQNIQFTKEQAKGAVTKQKLHLLHLVILKKIDQKRREEVAEINRELDALFLDLSRGTSFENKIAASDLADRSKNEIEAWADRLDSMGREKLKPHVSGPLFQACEEERKTIHAELKQILIDFYREKGELDVIQSLSHKENACDSSLKKLISAPPKKETRPPSWIATNARSLVLGLAPTLLGGFSSLSVYLGGVPLILKNFDYEKAFAFFTNPQVKGVEFAISILVTLYFGFSFLYTNRKNFKRYRELEKTEESIIQKEASLTVLDAEMLKLKEVKKSALQLRGFFKIFEAIASPENSAASEIISKSSQY